MPDPWTHKINQVSRWLENSRMSGEDLRKSTSYSKNLQEGQEDVEISGNEEKSSIKDKKTLADSHCPSGLRAATCTASFQDSIGQIQVTNRD